MTLRRLHQLRDYAAALELRARYTGIGNVADLEEIVEALQELIEIYDSGVTAVIPDEARRVA